MNETNHNSLSIPRILDANLDRAREGLRIIEEWCRFGLENSQLAEECKQMRQEIAHWHTSDLRLARDTPNDPGTELSHPQEEKRNSIDQLLQANLCRIQEALRVLEEYGKLYHPQMGLTFKQIRYQVYTLESNLLQSYRLQKLKESPLYLVTSPHDNLFSIVEKALQGGLNLVQYRDKNTDDIIKLETAKILCQLCHKYEALFIMNDRVDIALAVNADGVHLGQQDIPIALARQIIGPNRIIGRSTTNEQEMAKAITEGADYIGVGPVYSTPTKAGKKAAGLTYVNYATNTAKITWFAIGGIDTININEVINAGAKQIAVVRAIMEAENPTIITKKLLSQLKG
ncbi:thiamine phosphate synthase [Aphanothece sacrum]|uniref:Thiamine-phosphate synthase n=1 Tax=Aphanothece sacrum FPU1 TaxID=1920663 RepID=A0A401IFQ7_APHSA|nr:thiamine phosphate synthase [Aphanothece sacrum]GBF80046.1 thiamine-phosphate synthase [Aphanothece sacrum FPU1]GBF84589.1 thiamine-phosphate synthase [Aphanothece sacrum FPU3]